MAIWKEQKAAEQDQVAESRDTAVENKDANEGEGETATSRPVAVARSKAPSESVIAADLAIEGKIEGSGHVRLVGKFKGDVHVKGDLTIEPGAKVTGSVRAEKVTIGGELEGDIEAASTVELLETGVVNGDLTAASLTVASGSRMRGQVAFGWDEKELRTAKLKVESGSAQSAE